MELDDSGNPVIHTGIPNGLMAPTKSARHTHICSGCEQLSTCIPAPLKNDELTKFDNIIYSRRLLRADDTLYRQNSPCRSIYAIRSGSIKLTSLTLNGSARVIGFYFSGQVIGFDGISAGKYCSNAIALEPSTVCQIPFEGLCNLSRTLPVLQTSFMRMMSEAITGEQKLMRLMGKGLADERIATFLLVMSEVFRVRQESASQFTLPMSRTDAANFLGINIETLSRNLGEFAKKGYISVSRAKIQILDFDGLRKTAGDCGLGN